MRTANSDTVDNEAGGKVERRSETIAGCKVTIIKRGEIETVRGGPKCCWCGKPLRPKYHTERAPVDTEHVFEKEPNNRHAKFDEQRQRWVVVSTAYKVVQRTFEGSFGAYGDDHFCGLNCGRDFGLFVAQATVKGQAKLVNKQGKEIEVKKGCQ